MSQGLMFSLSILAFLLFMVIILLYIKKTVREEMNKVQTNMLIRFSAEYAKELYDYDRMDPETRVNRAVRLMEQIAEDWNIDVNYNKLIVKSRMRKLI